MRSQTGLGLLSPVLLLLYLRILSFDKSYKKFCTDTVHNTYLYVIIKNKNIEDLLT